MTPEEAVDLIRKHDMASTQLTLAIERTGITLKSIVLRKTTAALFKALVGRNPSEEETEQCLE